MDWPMKPRAEPPLDDIPSPLCESLAILILRDTEATPCEPRPARLQIDLAGGTSNHAEVPDMSVYHTWANHSFVNPDVIYALVCSDACLCGCGLRSFPLGIWFQGTKPTAKQRRQVLHKLRSGSPKRFVWSFHLNEKVQDDACSIVAILLEGPKLAAPQLEVFSSTLSYCSPSQASTTAYLPYRS